MAVSTPYHPFALVAEGLVFLPTPSVAHLRPYRTLFRKLHADEEFCRIAFGAPWKPVSWTDEEVHQFLLKRDAALRWGVRGMGDFGLGVLPTDDDARATFDPTQSRPLKNSKFDVRIVEGDQFESLSKLFDRVEWAGYTCVRDATTTSAAELYSNGSTDSEGKPLPPWQEMIELRYGLDSAFRGRGIATRAAEVVMAWAVEEHGARRFIADTQKANGRSKQVLSRLGFQISDTNYFQDEDVVEWARAAA
ncbi:GCN5-related N-acetyltransferase (GNAT) domain-containingprotein [Purpureocillium lavendulum]|uniref:GCN5-related N-acetyltransferase (GNAT) domain-containingprotein n=1 Tax=Purpureocillium lavendulum TaxID=1247861 RepID=A0AB34G013_9HYPO|nr:GCN5-related N-acetyltransferase (GNAT) domain-containingprotein [Purpureocillium lavendulum]